jgi:hypothetical protein
MNSKEKRRARRAGLTQKQAAVPTPEQIAAYNTKVIAHHKRVQQERLNACLTKGNVACGKCGVPSGMPGVTLRHTGLGLRCPICISK